MATQGRNIMQSITIVITVVVLCLFYSCNRTQPKPTIDAVTDRSQMPVLDATTVNTVISDSGVTRYRIKAPRWQIYDKAEPPYWEFIDGIVLEKFDEELNVDASLESDYAIYHERDQIWELDGNVRSINLKGEVFETPQLFWNQQTERIYSDSAITIYRSNSILKGIGFESNQTMSQYTIRNPQGVFPIDEEDKENKEDSISQEHINSNDQQHDVIE